MYFCWPVLLGVDVGPFTSAFLALTLLMAAISSESFRSAFAAIDSDQWDATVALGMPRWTTMLYVILPQSLLRAIPTLLSNGVTVFKESAIVSAVGIADIMFVGRNVSSATGHPIEILTLVAAAYFLFAYPMTLLVGRVERRILAEMSSS
jgi:polar amino acid transport system permease protein